MQLADRPVVARVEAHGVQPGDAIRVRLLAADTEQRLSQFQRVS